MTNRVRFHGFTLGMIYAAWIMDQNGQQTYAEEILLTLGVPVSTMRRMAAREEYRFSPRFWPNVNRKIARIVNENAKRSQSGDA